MTIASLIARVDAALAESAVTPASPAEVRAAAERRLALAGELRARLEAGEDSATMDGALRVYDLLVQLLDAGWADAVAVADTAVDVALRDEAEVHLRRFAEATTAVGLSRPVYDRVAAVDAAEAPEDVRLMLARILDGFRASGVDRDAFIRERLAALQAELTAVALVFDRNGNEGRREVIAGAGELAGLPADVLARHPAEPDGTVRLSTDWGDYSAVMAYAEDEGLRRRMHEASSRRAWPENEPVLERLLSLRQDLAQFLGQPSYAHLATRTNMTGDPGRVQAFLDRVAAAAEPAARRDRAALLERWRRIDPAARTLPPWSAAYVGRLLRLESFDFDAQALRRYLPYEAVLDGTLRLIEDLFGVEIRPWATPVWHADVQAFEMTEDGTLVGRFYLDMHPREGKYGHAKHLALRSGLAGRGEPVSLLLCNFPKGGHATGLLEHREAQTLLHEFGHLLHNLFSGGRDWHAQNYGRVEWDFIEAPSQLLEAWAWNAEVLTRFARDAEGRPPPADLLARMNAARGFGEALGDRRQLAFAAVSLGWHLRPPAPGELDALWAETFERYALAPAEAHGYASFGHLSGYTALYYTYLWSKVIALDLQSAFAGPFDTTTARRYRERVLAPGAAKPADALIRDFLGRPYGFEAYAERLGTEPLRAAA